VIVVLEVHHTQRGATLRNTSAPEFVTEFVAGLEALGVNVKGHGQQSARCWRHEDRHPSMSVNPSKCVYFCHACGEGGGLVDLRRHLGVSRPDDAPVSITAALNRLGALASPEADLLACIPDEAITELQTKTGRHKRPTVLADHLRRVLASIHATMTDRERTLSVPYTAAHAERDGIHPAVWHHLVSVHLEALGGPLITALGFIVSVGESGRWCGRRFRGTGNNGTFKATELTFTTNCEYPKLMEVSSNSKKEAPPRDIHNREAVVESAGPESVRRASIAARVPRSSRPNLHRRHAVAALLSDLALAGTIPSETGAGWGRLGLRTTMDLEAVYGPRIRRTIRAARDLGWVSVAVDPVDRSVGLVMLSNDGLQRLNDDFKVGDELLDKKVKARRDWWRRKQTNLRKEALERARAIARSHTAGRATPWVPIGEGRVRHELTAEITTLEALKA